MATAEQTAADDSTRGILPSADEMIQYAEHHLSTKEELGISQYGSIVDPLIPVWRDDLNILIISSNDPEKPSAPEATTLDMLDYYAQAANLKTTQASATPNVIVLNEDDPISAVLSGRHSEIYNVVFGGRNNVQLALQNVRIYACIVNNVLRPDGTIAYALIFIDKRVPEGLAAKCVADLIPTAFGIKHIVKGDINQRSSNPRYMLLNFAMIGAVSRIYRQNGAVGGLTPENLSSTIHDIAAGN